MKRNHIAHLPNSNIPLYWKRQNVYMLRDEGEIKRLLPEVNAHLALESIDFKKYREKDEGITRWDNSIGKLFQEYPNCGFFFYSKKREWPVRTVIDKDGLRCNVRSIEFDNVKRVEVIVFN